MTRRCIHKPSLSRRRRLQRGSTLIELMIAAMVFTVGALGLLRLIYASAEGVGNASRITYSTILATNKLDELIRLPFDSAVLTDGDHTDGAKNLGPSGLPYNPDGGTTADYGEADGWFFRSWTVVDEIVGSTYGVPTFKEIKVTVSWIDPKTKKQHDISLGAGLGRQQ